MKTICIMCPMGCSLEIEEKESDIMVSGNNCKRGVDYGKQEFVSPKRMVTSLVEADNDRVVSVKTSDLINKSQIFEVLEKLKDIQINLPVRIGDVLLENVCGSGVNIIATCAMDK